VTRDEQLVLAVDLGTGGPKVGFVSLTGQVAWQDHIAVETTWLPDGGAVQDANRWWELIGDAAGRGLASSAVDAARVVAVSVTGQWASTVPTAEDGTPVGDCIMWMDKRGGRHVAPIIGGRVAGYAPKRAVTWIRKTGAAPSPGGGDPLGHMLLLERDFPEVAKEARWFLEPVDHLTMRFTGRAVASHASQTGAWLTDNRKLDVLAYDEELVRLAEIDPSRLAPLVPTGSVVGEVLPAVASSLGLPAGVQVVTGIPDLHSATYGAGAVGDFEPHMTISTTSWISAPVPFKRTDALHGIATVPGCPPGTYLIVDNQDTAGRALEWLRDVLTVPGEAAPSYDELTALAAQAPPGSGNVVFTPWLDGERSPIDDRRARGGFHNVSLATTRADLVRAVLEGVASNSKLLLHHVERFARRRLDDIRLIGGGAISDLWCQILADVLDRRIERVHEPLHAGIRGAAVFAGIALGAVRPEEVRGLVRVDRTFTPDPANRDVYDRLSAELPKLHKAQKQMFVRLNSRRAT
jgi:xylulokinase